jgi:pimeloyl-ACP methyl ester carboxylesterase
MGLSESLVGVGLNTTSLVAPRVAGSVAYYLFCNPFVRGKVRDAEREIHGQATVGSLVVNGKKVVTYQWGEGARPVLMLHGWQSRASRYSSFVKKLVALGYSPVSFDAPGHGESEGRATTILEYREIIQQLADQHGEFEAILAHSFGVTCAFLALRSGVRAKRLVAISGVCDFEFLLFEFGRKLSLRDRVANDLRRRIEKQLFPTEEDIWNRFSGRYQPADITIPMLIIHDDTDVTVSLSQADGIVKAYGDQARFIQTTALGHHRIVSDDNVISEALTFIQAAPAERMDA